MKIKVFAKCPNCGTTKLVEYNPLMSLWCILPLIGLIVYLVYTYKVMLKRMACPKCGCQMQKMDQGAISVQQPQPAPTEVKTEEKK